MTQICVVYRAQANNYIIIHKEPFSQKKKQKLFWTLLPFERFAFSREKAVYITLILHYMAEGYIMKAPTYCSEHIV